MRKIIKILLSCVVLLTLEGCLGIGSDDALEVDTKAFTDPHFEIQYIADWIVRTRDDFGSEIPQETIVTFSNPEMVDGYQTTISVINDMVPPETTSLDYAKANIRNAMKNIIEFEKIEERNITIENNETKLLIFKGKSNISAKKLRYIQLYIVQQNRGYTVTASALLDTEETLINSLQDLVLSFKLLPAQDKTVET